MTDPFIHLDQLTVSGRLAPTTLTIPSGMTAIIGPSGAGKSTLINTLVGFETKFSGSFKLTEHSTHPERLHYYWQPPDYGLWSNLTVKQHLVQVTPSDPPIEPVQIIEALNMHDFLHQYPSTLSQGEQARAAFARTLLSAANIIFLDEPFRSLDRPTQSKAWELLAQYHNSGHHVVIATHDTTNAKQHATHFICMNESQAIYDGTFETLQLEEAHDETERIEDQAKTKRIVKRSEILSWFTCLLILISLMTISGCKKSDTEPKLKFTKINIWNMPNLGPRIPAPRSLCFGPNGNAYVLDNAGRILVYNTSGKVIKQWFMPEYDVGKPEGIVVLKDGRIAVADTHYSRIVIFTPNGEVSTMFGEYGVKPGQFIYPVTITQDPDGFLYVGEYGTLKDVGSTDRVQKFTLDGKVLKVMGKMGTADGEFQRASGVAWYDGNVYVADAVNNRIQHYRDDGTFKGVIGKDRKWQLKLPYDIATDSQGMIYVIEYSGNRITKVDPSGKLIGRFGRSGSDIGHFTTPWGIAVSQQGRIIVADTTNRRVVELIP